MKRRPPLASVYFVYCAGFIKIGFATNVAVRLGGIADNNPHRATVLWSEPGDRKLERRYHERFAAARSSGEWFEFSADLRHFLLENLSPTLGGVDRMARVEAEFLEWAIGATRRSLGGAA